MIRSEVTVLISYVLKLARCLIDYLHIAGKVFLTVNLAKSVEGFIRDICDIKLMIACED